MAIVFDRELLKSRLGALAKRGVFVGTSSWKYEGWCGMLYDEQRYVYRGKWAESRFEKNCLAEYAEVFKTVCVDAGYYRFPEQKYVEGLLSQVPADFLFTFKVTDEITIKNFPNLPKHGERAGKPNENYLNADLFASVFGQTFEQFKRNIGMFIFEFSKFYQTDYAHGRDFLVDLDRFLSAIPKGWNYGVEIRNKHFLKPEYFALLAKHGVSHVFNSWTEMPSLGEQLALDGCITCPDCAGARMLLKPGRKYQDAVDLFSPYKEVKDAYPEGSAAAADLIRQTLMKQALRRLFLYVNNRFEGNALLTIMGILQMLEDNAATTRPVGSGASSGALQTPSSLPTQPQ